MFTGSLDGQSIRIGELLVLSGALQSGDVVEAVTVSKRLTMPVGRVLIVSGCITEELLEASLQAQILMWEGSISVELAEAALKLVSFNRIPLHEALGELQWEDKFDSATVSLADLLLEADIVSQHELELALHASSLDLVPLSSELIVRGLLSAKFFPMVGQIQQKIVAGRLNREEAIDELKAAYLLWLKAEQSIENDEPPKLESYTGPLLETQALIDVASHSPTASSFANIEFPTADRLTENELPTSRDGSSMRANPDLTGEAENALQLINRESYSRIEPLEGRHNVRLIDLLVASTLVTVDQANQAYEHILDDPRLSSNMLLATGLLDHATCNAALKCHDLLIKHLISEQQALQWLRARTSPPQETPNQVQPPEGGAADLPPEDDFQGRVSEVMSPKRRSSLRHALTAAVIGGIAAVAVMTRKR